MKPMTTALVATLLTVAVSGAAHGCAPTTGTPTAPTMPAATAAKPTCTQANTATDFFAGDCVAPPPDPHKPYPTTELDKSDGGRVPDFLPGGFEVMCDPASHSIQELRPDTPDTRARAAIDCAR